MKQQQQQFSLRGRTRKYTTWPAVHERAYVPNPRLQSDYSANKFLTLEVGSAPTLTVQSNSPLSGSYLLAMLDADVPNSKLPQGTNCHWLVRGVIIDQSEYDRFQTAYSSAQSISSRLHRQQCNRYGDYTLLGSLARCRLWTSSVSLDLPPELSASAHIMDSYVIMLYIQPDDFAPPSEFAGSDMPVRPMNWNAYVTV